MSVRQFLFALVHGEDGESRLDLGAEGDGAHVVLVPVVHPLLEGQDVVHRLLAVIRILEQQQEGVVPGGLLGGDKVHVLLQHGIGLVSLPTLEIGLGQIEGGTVGVDFFQLDGPLVRLRHDGVGKVLLV